MNLGSEKSYSSVSESDSASSGTGGSGSDSSGGGGGSSSYDTSGSSSGGTGGGGGSSSYDTSGSSSGGTGGGSSSYDTSGSGSDSSSSGYEDWALAILERTDAEGSGSVVGVVDNLGTETITVFSITCDAPGFELGVGFLELPYPLAGGVSFPFDGASSTSPLAGYTLTVTTSAGVQTAGL